MCLSAFDTRPNRKINVVVGGGSASSILNKKCSSRGHLEVCCVNTVHLPKKKKKIAVNFY